MRKDDRVENEINNITKQILEPYCCIACKRRVAVNELYGAFGMCSQCLAMEGLDEHEGG